MMKTFLVVVFRENTGSVPVGLGIGDSRPLSKIGRPAAIQGVMASCTRVLRASRRSSNARSYQPRIVVLSKGLYETVAKKRSFSAPAGARQSLVLSFIAAMRTPSLFGMIGWFRSTLVRH